MQQKYSEEIIYLPLRDKITTKMMSGLKVSSVGYPSWNIGKRKWSDLLPHTQLMIVNSICSFTRSSGEVGGQVEQVERVEFLAAVVAVVACELASREHELLVLLACCSSRIVAGK